MSWSLLVFMQAVELLPEPDLSKLGAAARAGLDQMPGCYVMQAQVENTTWMGLLPDTETYEMHAQLVDGQWQGLEFSSLSDSRQGMAVSLEHGDQAYPFMPPLLGRLPEGESGSLDASAMQEILDQISTDVQASYATLGELDGSQAYVLERSIELDSLGRRELDLRVWIEDNQTRARRWEARMRRGVRMEDGGRLRGVVVVLEVDEQGLPASEILRGTMRLGPLALRVRQSIAYEVIGTC